MLSIGTLGVYYFQHRFDPKLNETMMSDFSSFNTTLSPEVSQREGSIIPLICVTVFVSSFSLGVGPITWIIITEITPPQTVGLIISTSSMFAWIFTFIIVRETEDLKNLLESYGLYWLFAGISFLCGVFAYFLPETKGKTMGQIAQIFKYDT